MLLLLKLSSASRPVAYCAACYIQWAQDAVEVPAHQKVAMVRQGLLELLLEECWPICARAWSVYTGEGEWLSMCQHVY